MFELDLTECEVLIMKIIWESGEILSAQEITARVNKTYKKDWKHQTVSVFLGRIIKKGYLTSERRGRLFFYHPLITEAEYGEREIRKCVDFWSQGRADVFLSALHRTRNLTEEEKQELRSFLDELD